MKKTIFKYTVLAALVCICASCQKGLEEVQEGGLTVTATIAGGGTGSAEGTKVLAEDTGTALKLKWEVGDIVFGFDDATPTPNTYSFKVASIDDGKATLRRIMAGSEKGTAKTDPANGTKMYLFYAPGMKASGINTSEKSLTVDISRQTAAVPALMTAQSTVQNGTLTLNFTVQTALIGVKTPTMATVGTDYTSIVLTSTGPLATQVKFYLDGGELKVDYEQATTGTSITKEVDFSSGSEGKVSDVIYIAACPFSQATPGADLTFTAVTSGNKKEAFTKTGITEVEFGKYYHISPEFESIREIEVLFGDATCDLFDDELTFSNGTTIKVSNGTDTPVDCSVTVSGGIATIKTKLTGPLTLAYPSTAAKMNGANIEDVLVSATQDGTAAGAIFAKTSIDENATTAVFDNQTAVFKITLPSLSGMTGLTIKSLPPVPNNQSFRAGTKADINTAGTDADAKSVITVPGDLTESSPIYVSLVPGVCLCDLAFDAVTGDYTGSMAGIPGSVIASQATAAGKDCAVYNTTAANTLYPVADFHEYVNVNDVKWAKTNIGATTETGRGKYFAWAETDGHDITNFDAISTTVTSSGAFANSFTKSSTPYYNGASYPNAEYSEYAFNNATLHLKDDAAYVNWGGPWSIPTSGNYSDLLSKGGSMERTKTTINISESTYGYRFTVTGGTIFFPAAGYGDGTTLKEYGSSATPSSSNKFNCKCLYWSNTVSSSDPSYDKAYSFLAYDEVSRLGPTAKNNKNNNDVYRHDGLPIRPVSAY